MRKKLATLSLVLILIALIAGGTWAYFTDIDEAVNVVTLGKIDITLHETGLRDGKERPYEDVVNVVPGQTVSKIVRIQNTGSSAAYIRVSVDKEIKLAEGVSGTPDVRLIKIDFNRDKWILADGYYYYKSPLEPGDSTEALFEELRFDARMNDMYQNSTAVVAVKAYATQVKNNDSGGALGARGWPEADEGGGQR